MELPSERGLAGDDAWVRLGHDPRGRRWRIAGNAHTHRGHFHVETADGVEDTANLADVVEASPLAQAWLSGFLQGQEVGWFEFLGRNQDLFEDDDDGDTARWQAWNAWFRAKGWIVHVPDLPPVTAELRELSGQPAWALVGGLFRVVHDGRWEAAEPQPVEATPETWAWPGSICEQRGHHALEQFEDGVLLCEDCHEASC